MEGPWGTSSLQCSTQQKKRSCSGCKGASGAILLSIFISDAADSPPPLLVVAADPCAHSAAVANAHGSNLSEVEVRFPAAAVNAAEIASQRQNNAAADPLSGVSELVDFVVAAADGGTPGSFVGLVT